MKKKMIALGVSIGLLLLASYDVSFGDDAEVLPKKVWSISLYGKFYFPIEKKYDPDGKTEDAAADFNSVLDSSVFSDLALIESFFGMPPGSANIGRSDVSFDYHITIAELTVMYGITDRLSVGVFFPYQWVKNKVDARLDTSNATVGKNAFLNTLTPLTVPGTVPLTTQDAQNLIGRGLDVNGDGVIDIPGYGYKPIKTSSDHGIKDIEVGFRYQYFKNENWRLAFMGAVRLPTGELDDPDNLVDYSFGSGAYALLFRLNNDFIRFKKFVLNGTIRYDLILPHKETLRVPDTVNQPITFNKERVKRNIGDVMEFELSGKYAVLEPVSLSLTYKYGFSFKDRVSGDRGLAYESLEDETDYTEHVLVAGLSYSTIPLFMKKKFPIPLVASVDYRNRFAGSNNVFKSQYIGLGLQVFF